MKYLLALLLLLHGAVHFMGWAKGLGLAKVAELQMDIGRGAAWLWGIAGLLLIAAGAAYFSRLAWWWMPGMLGVLLSQALIIAFWQDARYGTLANLLLLLPLLSGYGQWQFGRQTEQAQTELLQAAQSVNTISEAELAGLPKPVQTWLRASGIVGRAGTASVRAVQEGQLRTSPDGKWMPFQAVQYASVYPPAFTWSVRTEMMPGLPLLGRDRYAEGKGQMLIKALALLPVVDEQGPEIDQGSLLRFLGEIVWLPSAALSDYIQWTAVDEQRARARMSYGGVEAEGLFTFTDSGDFKAFEAERYYSRGEEPATLERWQIEAVPGAYAEFDGRRLPSEIKITWKLAEGDYYWYAMQLKSAAYSPK